MKKATRNTKSSGKGKWRFLAAAAIAVAAIAGIIVGLGRIRDIVRDPCVVRSMSEQIEIRSGKMVKPDVIAENLGLRPGVNLAEIDFTERRKELLARIPTLREVSITRRLPDRVLVVAEEREPVARIGVRGQRGVSGRVVDAEGMVFLCQRGTHLLPAISEPSAPGTQPGRKVKKRTLAALALILACRDGAFSELGLQAVDVSKPDYLLATLGDYSRLKIAWDGMDDQETEASRKSLDERLSLLVKTIRSNVAPGAKTWNATMPKHIYADSQERR